jgi:Na+/melibiose symporter-like transporter
VSLYLQQSLHYSALQTGMCFVPMALTVFVSSQLAGRLSSRLGAAPVLVGGMTLIALGLFGFSRVSPDGSFLRDTLAPGIVTAAGLGFSYVPVTILAMTGVRGGESGVVSGLLNTFRQIGGSLGLAVLATIAANRAAQADDPSSVVALTDGFRLAFTVGGCIAAVGAIVALSVLARRPAPAPAPTATDASR